MPALKWDLVGERFYEYGVSKGVIYMQDGRNVAWSGLLSVDQGNDRSTTPIYYDGMKVNDLVSPSSYKGKIEAITYPDEVLELEGLSRMTAGIYLGEQNPETFNFSYQTKIGNDTGGQDLGYKIHLLYNVTLIAQDQTHQTLSADFETTPFTWDITSVPQEVPNHMPSARIMLDSRMVPKTILDSIELRLYGKDTLDANPPSFDELVDEILSYLAVDILDRKDGTFSATSDLAGYVVNTSATEFELRNVDAEYIDADTYNVSDTKL